MPLPSRRHPVRGRDLDGNDVDLEWSISRKLYVCPACRGRIEIGEEHVFVRRHPPEGSYHQHWHQRCARELSREIEIAASLKMKRR
jgi:hypothetical protein